MECTPSCPEARRGVYDSKMYNQLNDRAANFSASNFPLEDAVGKGNDNPSSAHVNSRVIQMVLAKNLTLAQA